MPDYIGRRVSVGVGLESVYGTAVAPAFWPRHMKFGFKPMQATVDNESAMGRNEGINDSAVAATWAEGPIQGKVYDLSIGAFLANMFGAPTTTDNADSDATIKDHTFNVSTSNQAAKALTVTRVTPVNTNRFAMGTLESLELTCEQEAWVMMSGGLKSIAGATNTDTASYAVENSFTSKHVIVKLATDTSGLSAASGLAIKKLRLTMKRSVERYVPFGGTAPTAFNTGRWDFDGEVTLKYAAADLEAIWYANTRQALQISIVNTDVTIGAAAHPGLVFTAPKVRLNTFDLNDDLDAVIEQTIGIKGEFDSSAGYMLRPVLTNNQASY